MIIEFDADRHLYRLNGRHVPSVTEVGVGLGLIDPTWFTEESRVRGRHVHKAVHYWLLDDLKWETVHEPWVGYVRAAIRYLEETKAVTIATEKIVGSEEFGFCGTADHFGIVLDEESLDDWKSGALGAWIGPQTAGYDLAWPLPDGQRRRRRGIQLHDDGTYKATDLTRREGGRNDYARFLNGLDLYRHFKFREEVLVGS